MTEVASELLAWIEKWRGEAGESSYILSPFSGLSAPHNENLAPGELHRLASALLCS
jgi:hypothetical protein